MGESILNHRRKPPLDTSAMHDDEARRGPVKGSPVLIPELSRGGCCGILCRLVVRQEPTWRIRPEGREELSFLVNGMNGLVNRVARREGLSPKERRVSCDVRAAPVWNLKIQGESCAPSH